MTWKWLSSIVISLGAELNAMMEHHTACDTTQESPCVQRGARSAGGGRSREKSGWARSGPQAIH
jgi:membrane protein